MIVGKLIDCRVQRFVLTLVSEKVIQGNTECLADQRQMPDLYIRQLKLDTTKMCLRNTRPLGELIL